jgi:acyl-CoA thioesterase FadM
VHGNILNGFISHFIGMEYPAGNVIIHSLSLTYKSPCFLEDKLIIEAKVDQKIESVNALVLKLKITNSTQGNIASTGKIQVGFLE